MSAHPALTGDQIFQLVIAVVTLMFGAFGAGAHFGCKWALEGVRDRLAEQRKP